MDSQGAQWHPCLALGGRAGRLPGGGRRGRGGQEAATLRLRTLTRMRGARRSRPRAAAPLRTSPGSGLVRGLGSPPASPAANWQCRARERSPNPKPCRSKRPPRLREPAPRAECASHAQVYALTQVQLARLCNNKKMHGPTFANHSRASTRSREISLSHGTIFIFVLSIWY